MSVTPAPDEFDYGVNSPSWMAKVIAQYASSQYLRVAVVKMIDYLCYGGSEEEGTDVIVALDIFVQWATTGKYVETAPHDCEREFGFEGVVLDSTPEQLPEEEQEAAINAFVDTLNNLSPDSVDPWDGFDIDKFLNKEDDK